MLLGIAGVSGVGKSYYKRRIVEELGFRPLTIVTTRAPRVDDQSGEKVHVSPEEFQRLCSTGEIAFGRDYCGKLYGYLRDELDSDEHLVCEFPYSFIDDFKRTCPNNFRSIYLFPCELEIAKNHLRSRELAPGVEAFRLAEMDEHLAYIKSDPEILAAYDKILYNDYDPASEERILDYVRELLGDK